MKEYKVVHPITFKGIMEYAIKEGVADSCFFRHFAVAIQESSETPTDTPIDLSFFASHRKAPEWLPWLEEHGFIEEVKHERLFHSGQVINVGYLGSGTVSYLLLCTYLDETERKVGAALYSLGRCGDWHGEVIPVRGRDSITFENIMKMLHVTNGPVVVTAKDIKSLEPVYRND